uniref:Polymerase n=1 Tax=Phakopsora pachyrhizi mycovirus 2 TaxID=2592804 RepID=A0A7G3KH59_9VIRU|nr:polymerase [Phakopsora pachyrhizi mycovirus 2]
MQAVLLAYSKVFGQYFSEEQARAFDWVLQSLDYQYVKDGDSWYRTVGTLLSGWRLTTAINTMLNKIYTMYCTIDEPIVSIHNGDDILAAVTTIEQISRLENKAKASGIRFQRQKCYLASIAEFLRVDHKSGSNAQYLARGVSTFVHGPTETALPNDLLAVLKSNHTRASELIARGADADKVWSYLNLQIDHLAGLWHTERDKLDKIMSTHISLGGFSQVVDEKSTAFEIVRDWDDDESGLDDVHEEDKNIVMHGAVDYARMVCRHMVAPEYEQRIAKRIKKSLFFLL